MRPGITGLAQVSGRNALDWDAKLRADGVYVDSPSNFQDLSVIWRTLLKVLRRGEVTVVAGQTGEPLDVERSYSFLHGLRLRRFSVGDIPQRVEWMRDSETSSYMRLPKDPKEESTRKWFENAFQDPQRHDFVAYEPTTRANVAMIGVKASDASALPDLYVFVDPKRHGRGLGKTTLTLLLMWMQETGSYAGCRLDVSEANHAAVALYEGLGFEKIHSGVPGRLSMSLTVADWMVSE